MAEKEQGDFVTDRRSVLFGMTALAARPDLQFLGSPVAAPADVIGMRRLVLQVWGALGRFKMLSGLTHPSQEKLNQADAWRVEEVKFMAEATRGGDPIRQVNDMYALAQKINAGTVDFSDPTDASVNDMLSQWAERLGITHAPDQEALHAHRMLEMLEKTRHMPFAKHIRQLPIASPDDIRQLIDETVEMQQAAERYLGERIALIRGEHMQEAVKGLIAEYGKDMQTIFQHGNPLDTDTLLNDLSTFHRVMPASAEQLRNTLYESYFRLTGLVHAKTPPELQEKWKELEIPKPLLSQEAILDRALKRLEATGAKIQEEDGLYPAFRTEEEDPQVQAQVPATRVHQFVISFPKHRESGDVSELSLLLRNSDLTDRALLGHIGQESVWISEDHKTMRILAPGEELTTRLRELMPKQQVKSVELKLRDKQQQRGD